MLFLLKPDYGDIRNYSAKFVVGSFTSNPNVCKLMKMRKQYHINLLCGLINPREICFQAETELMNYHWQRRDEEWHRKCFKVARNKQQNIMFHRHVVSVTMQHLMLHAFRIFDNFRTLAIQLLVDSWRKWYGW